VILLQPAPSGLDICLAELVSCSLPRERDQGAGRAQEFGQPFGVRAWNKRVGTPLAQQHTGAGLNRFRWLEGDHGAKEHGTPKECGPGEQETRGDVRAIGEPDRDVGRAVQAVGRRRVFHERRQLPGAQAEILEVEDAFSETAKEPRRTILEHTTARAEQRGRRHQQATQGNEVVLITSGAVQKQQRTSIARRRRFDTIAETEELVRRAIDGLGHSSPDDAGSFNPSVAARRSKENAERIGCEMRGDDDDRGSPGSGAVRLDKWLWAARFFKTRTLATEAVNGGKVELNGMRPKPAKEVKVVDQLRVRLGSYVHAVTVRALSERRGSAVAAALLFEETADSLAARERLREQHRMAPTVQYDEGGRPTKKDRRALSEFAERHRKGRG